MNFPFSVDNSIRNNVLMFPEDGPYDLPRAFRQWRSLYRVLANRALVYVLPSGNMHLQDLPYVANLGAYLPHRFEPTIALSNFKSAPRAGETTIGYPFLAALNYEVHQSPHHFEGEADLKWLRHNIYIGGFGQRSDLAAFSWMEQRFGMYVHPVKLNDPKAYHLDCSVFPLDGERVLTTTPHEIEPIADPIVVPPEHAYDGWTNSLRIGGTVFHAPRSPESAAAFGTLLERHGLDLLPVELDEFEKSGADLSCLVMHLNRSLTGAAQG